MSKNLLKTKLLTYSAVFMSVVVAAAVVTTVLYSGTSNRKTTHVQLEQIVNQKNLEFQAKLNSQIILALQMSKSPVIVDYFQDPEDKNLYNQALKEFAAYQDSFIGKSSFWINSTDKRFYSNLKYSYTVDPSNPDDYWYNMTLNETPVYNFNINYNKELKATFLWLNVVVRDSKEKAIGIVGTGIPLTGFINDMYKGIPESLEMYLYNEKLEVTGAKDSSILADKIPVTDFFKQLDKEKLSVKSVSHISSHGEFVISPVDVIGWNLIVCSKNSILNYFTLEGVILGTVMILIGLVINTLYGLMLFKLMKSTLAHLYNTKDKAGQQVETMDQVNSTINENVEYLGQFGLLMQNQINQIATSVENTDELMNELEAINILRKDSIESTNELSDSSENGNHHVANITAKIEELNECTKRLSSANKLIAGITSKTNLLAMNAAIEASHAGEQGRGFAVVAKEIRALAEKSRAQQQDVSRAIDEINLMVREMVGYSETAKESFDQIVQNTQKVQDNFQNMSNKLESEASLVQTISANLQSVSISNQKINLNFSEMKQNNQQVSTEIQNAVENANELLIVTDELLTQINGKVKDDE